MKEKLNENIMKVLMNESNYLSAETIAKRLNVNEKTIRRRILQMQGDMLEEIGRIVSKKGSGYKLVIENKEEFSKYYDYVVAEVQINNPMNRRTAIFEHLIYHSYSKKEELLNKFFISEVTLMADIKMLNEYTKRNNVQIKLLKKRGYFVTGDEYHIRNTLLKLIYDSGAVRVRRRKSRDVKDNFVGIIRKFFTEEGYFLNKHALDAIINYLLVSVGNILKGRILEIDNNDEYQELGKEFIELAHKLHNITSLKMNMTFPLTETIFFAYFLKSVMPLEMINIPANDSKYAQKAKCYTEKAIAIIKGLGSNEVSDDCKKDIQKFLYSFIIRVDLDIQKREKIHYNIERNYGQAYWISKVIFGELSTDMKVEISKEEIAYFTMIIVNYYFSYTKQNKTILAILPSEYTSSRVYRDRFRHMFDYDIQFVSYKEYMSMEKIDENEYGIIVNPYSYLSNNTKVKKYDCFDFISRDDISNILRILSYKNYTQLMINLKKIANVHYKGDFNYIQKQLCKEKGYTTTIYGSYIAIQRLASNKTIEYSVYENDYVHKLIVLINADLSADEINDLLKIAIDAVIKLNINNEVKSKEGIVEYYSK